jgi:flagellar FliJ protein
MARFVFRLEKLLKLRERQRQERELALAQAQQAVRILDDQIAQLADEQAANRETARRALRQGKLEVDRLLDCHRYELLLAGQERALRQQRERIVQEADRRRQAVVEADRKVKVLEKLRARKQAEFAREEQRRETLELDEVAQRRTAAW